MVNMNGLLIIDFVEEKNFLYDNRFNLVVNKATNSHASINDYEINNENENVDQHLKKTAYT